MRKYRPEPVRCSRCGQPIRHPEPYLMSGDTVRHAVNCLAGKRT